MREHPIPQDITNYKFHLVGSMTLKQFAELLAGVILGLISYKTNLPGFIKWPMTLGFVGMGAAAAFVPIEGRPLDQWIINFIKVLYKPTKFNWTRESKIPDAFTYKKDPDQEEIEAEIDYSPIRREKTKEFLQSINRPQTQLDEFDRQELVEVNQILQTFSQVKVQTVADSQKPVRPNLKVRVRKMKPMARPKVVFDRSQTQTQATPALAQQNENQAASVNEESYVDQQPEPVQDSPQTKHSVQKFNGHAQTASQNQDLPFPNKPTQPNKVVGMVIAQNNNLIDNALIEIKNDQGQTITAVKSNALGQFFISQQLSNGIFYIKPSKQGYEFENLKLELSGDIIDPLEIRSVN